MFKKKLMLFACSFLIGLAVVWLFVPSEPLPSTPHSRAFQTTIAPSPAPSYFSVNFVVDGGGSPITTGSKGYVSIPVDCTIVGGAMFADQTGDIVVSIKKAAYSGFPTTSGITSSAPLTISSGTKCTDTTLTGWTTSITTGDVLEYNVDSIDTITRVTVYLRFLKS